MDWSQISVGAVAGAAATWLGGVFRTWFEYRLDQRKHRADEDRAVRAEQRDEARKEKERKQVEDNHIKHDADELLLYKTQLTGSSDLFNASLVAVRIHDFFTKRPQYLKFSPNRSFLEKYPADFNSQVCYDASSLSHTALDDLKHDVEVLQVH